MVKVKCIGMINNVHMMASGKMINFMVKVPIFIQMEISILANGKMVLKKAKVKEYTWLLMVMMFLKRINMEN